MTVSARGPVPWRPPPRHRAIARFSNRNSAVGPEPTTRPGLGHPARRESVGFRARVKNVALGGNATALRPPRPSRPFQKMARPNRARPGGSFPAPRPRARLPVRGAWPSRGTRPTTGSAAGFAAVFPLCAQLLLNRGRPGACAAGQGDLITTKYAGPSPSGGWGQTSHQPSPALRFGGPDRSTANGHGAGYTTKNAKGHHRRTASQNQPRPKSAADEAAQMPVCLSATSGGAGGNQRQGATNAMVASAVAPEGSAIRSSKSSICPASTRGHDPGRGVPGQDHSGQHCWGLVTPLANGAAGGQSSSSTHAILAGKDGRSGP